MIEYPYLSYPRDDEEKEKEKIENGNEEMTFIVNDDFFKFKKEFSENEDKDIYKEDIKAKETIQTEMEENFTNTLSSNRSLNSFILYNPKNSTITKKKKKKKSEKNHFQCSIGNKINEHNKFKPDNIRIKIKTHFHNFILNFFNDLIKSRFTIQRYKFRKICYSITKDVTVKNNLNLMNMTLGKFLSQKISKKYKCNSNQNEKTVQILLQMLKNENDKKLFDINYADFYINFYLTKNKTDIIHKFGLKNRTEFFYDFISRINQKNYERSVIDIAENHFVNYFSKNLYSNNSKFNLFNKNVEKENKNEKDNFTFLQRKRENDENDEKILNFFINNDKIYNIFKILDYENIWNNLKKNVNFSLNYLSFNN